jgi:hypothetical protein
MTEPAAEERASASRNGGNAESRCDCAGAQCAKHHWSCERKHQGSHSCTTNNSSHVPNVPTGLRCVSHLTLFPLLECTCCTKTTPNHR